MDAGARNQPEIDGLRAVAIIPVVLFHAGWGIFQRGFVGVDVFFVLSGFLIGRLLLTELRQTGSIDFLSFYARRIRRLFPALATVVAATLIVGSMLLSAAGDRQDLSQSAVATMGFVSNIYFWHTQANYFAPPSDWIALRNMWTLSIEEQFYLLWPVLMLAAAWYARRIGRSLTAVLGILLVLLIVVSLAMFLWGAGAKPIATYYLAPPRAWEFALGAALALLEPSLHGRHRLGAVAAALGLVLIAVTVTTSWAILSLIVNIVPAVVGTVLIIAGLTAAPASPLTRLLRIKPLVVIGKLSYSWYLWHWPLLALARLQALDGGRLGRDLLVALASLGLAALTYRIIENPIRRHRPWPFAGARATVFAGVGVSLAVMALAAALFAQANAVLRRDPWLQAVVAAARDRVHLPPGCNVHAGFSALLPAQDCRLGARDGPPRILLWGDSQAEQFGDLLRADGTRAGYAAIGRSMRACPSFLHGAYGKAHAASACVRFNNAVMAELPALARAGVTGILLASRSYGYPWRGDAAALAVWRDSLRAILSEARRLGMRVLLVAPIPVFKLALPQCLAYASAARCGDSRASLQEMHQPPDGALARIVGDFANAWLWDPFATLCSAQSCPPMHDGIILYSNSGHLSRAGSRSLAPLAAPQLRWLRGE